MYSMSGLFDPFETFYHVSHNSSISSDQQQNSSRGVWIPLEESIESQDSSSSLIEHLPQE